MLQCDLLSMLFSAAAWLLLAQQFGGTWAWKPSLDWQLKAFHLTAELTIMLGFGLKLSLHMIILATTMDRLQVCIENIEIDSG